MDSGCDSDGMKVFIISHVDQLLLFIHFRHFDADEVVSLFTFLHIFLCEKCHDLVIFICTSGFISTKNNEFVSLGMASKVGAGFLGLW
jgi:hypothetical protein